MDAHPSPAFDFEGILNFRDFGGWSTHDGGQVRQGLLFRSANHCSATTADLQRLADLGVGVIVDLRRPPERRREPSATLAGYAPVVVHDDVSPDEEASAPHLAFIENADKSAEWVIDWLLDSYRSYPFDPGYSSVFRRHFQALAETDAAVLVHCAAGKDRTGVLCALTLHTLGVGQDSIHRDYLETNRMSQVESRLAPLVERLERERGRPVNPEVIRAALSADLRYLEAAFAAIAERHDDVDAYLEQVLGVTPAVKTRLRERLVE
jgi:protein tyrosine/serine phosphatase